MGIESGEKITLSELAQMCDAKLPKALLAKGYFYARKD